MGAVFALFSGWYFWIPKILGLWYNLMLSKVHFWVFFVGVNVTFFPQHFLGLQGMPRRISDYPDAFTGWNFISSIGSILSVVSLALFLQIVYLQLVNGKAVFGYPWAIPQLFTDYLRILKDKCSPGLEWALDNPPKPHAFTSLPLQSTPAGSNNDCADTNENISDSRKEYNEFNDKIINDTYNRIYKEYNEITKSRMGIDEKEQAEKVQKEFDQENKLISLRNKADAFDLKNKYLNYINSNSNYSEENKKELCDKVITLLDEACIYGATNEEYNELTIKLNVMIKENDDKNTSKDENSSKDVNSSSPDYGMNITIFILIFFFLWFLLIRPIIVVTLTILSVIVAMLDEIESKNQENASKNQVKPHSFYNGSLRSSSSLFFLTGESTFIDFTYFKNKINNILCDAPRAWGIYFQDSASPQMEALVELHNNIMYYLFAILFSVGWIQGSIIRNFDNRKFPISNKYLNHGTLIELIWTITPALILVLIAFPSFKLLYLMDEVVDPSLSVLAEGHQWYWSYEYPDFLNSDGDFIEFDSYLVPESDLEEGALRMLEVDNRVIIPEITHTRFIVTAADVIHSFAIPALGVKCDAYPGRLNQFSVLMNRLGTFYGQCSEICGILHSSMPIVVQSVSIEKFLSWLREQ
jgi:cytochrome c oxidase subunit 2